MSSEVKVQQTDLKCDICGAPMTLERYRTGLFFKCTNCEQDWSYTSALGFSCTILGRLFPSFNSFDEMSMKLLRDYLDYQVKDGIFKNSIRKIAGEITEQQYQEIIADVKRQAEEILQEQISKRQQKKRLWWKLFG